MISFRFMYSLLYKIYLMQYQTTSYNCNSLLRHITIRFINEHVISIFSAQIISHNDLIVYARACKQRCNNYLAYLASRR